MTLVMRFDRVVRAAFAAILLWCGVFFHLRECGGEKEKWRGREGERIGMGVSFLNGAAGKSKRAGEGRVKSGEQATAHELLRYAQHLVEYRKETHGTSNMDRLRKRAVARTYPYRPS